MWWPQGRGRGNVVRGNCVHGGAGTIDAGDGGLTVGAANLFVDPGYRDRAGKDFRLRPGSACEAILSSAP